jgi:hypothetical protein
MQNGEKLSKLKRKDLTCILPQKFGDFERKGKGTHEKVNNTYLNTGAVVNGLKALCCLK